MTKRRKQRLIRVLGNYFNRNDFEIDEQSIGKATLSIGYEKSAVVEDKENDTVYYLLDVTNTVEDKEKVAQKIVALSVCGSKARILLIVDSMQDKLKINSSEYKKDLKNQLKKHAEFSSKIKTVTDISAEFVSSEKNSSFEISVNNRVDRLTYDLPQGNALGNVYIASLEDIVKLYNKIGDSLFDLNVRYNIRDVLNVEKEINKTLTQYPERFWFLNNGITIIADRSIYKTDKICSIVLEDSDGFSVINGAQTITTAAKCFNENSPADGKKFADAKVLLRVISVDSISSDFPHEVSVALNRQKSITQVDIATSYEFAENLNSKMQECDNDAICFELNKRGGTPTFKYYYFIDEFAQLVEAYLNQKPGSSRSGKGALISISNDGENTGFTRKDIFVEIETAKDIEKYYSPVNYAYELLEAYKLYNKKQEDDELKSRIMSYASYYFISAIVLCVNDNNTKDFSNFTYLSKEKNQKFAEKFTDCFYKFLKSKDISAVDSNDFKTEKYYEDFKSSEYMEELYDYVKEIKSNV